MKKSILIVSVICLLIILFVFPGASRIALLMHELKSGSSFTFQGVEYSITGFVLVGDNYNGGFALSSVDIYGLEPVILHLQNPIDNMKTAIESGVLVFGKKVSSSCELYEIHFKSMVGDSLLINKNEGIFYTIGPESISRIDLSKLCLSVVKKHI
ncbi:hypothetical protein [Rheinheimera sp.]|uniref:hypothetical protein n=1 Tax=Rheinheimera sp. TaxID=1869214 RepID=UPI003D2CC170